MQQVWNRPSIPEKSQSSLALFGWMLMATGVCLAGLGASAAISQPIIFLLTISLGGFVLSAGLLLLLLSVVVNEIRLMAFEAALRAGEVQTSAPAHKDPYEEMLARDEKRRIAGSEAKG